MDTLELLKSNSTSIISHGSGNDVAFVNNDEDEQCLGSLQGVFKYSRYSSLLKPDRGAEIIVCLIPRHLLAEAKKASDKRIELAGLIKYKKNDTFPYAIEVTDISILDDKYSFLEWKELRGCAPNATGSLNSVEFIRKLRNEW